MPFAFDNTYTRLPAPFFSRVAPTPVATPSLLMFNRSLAESLGIDPDQLTEAEWADRLSGNTPLPGSDPIAQAYAGHQFGGFTVLGDGRAILLGEHRAAGGERYDIQLKGSGPTPYARRGDGRAAVGPMLREYIISEAMHHLGIPTTRSLAVVATGETVRREQPLPGAVLTRVAASHLRVGTFEYFAARGDAASLKVLADYTIQRHFPQCAESSEPYRELLRITIERQVSLVVQWLLVGFVHGVMNTDNVAVSGETLDYGPCAFMNRYDPATVFSSIDRDGRYAYGNQPAVTQWNMARFAETLLPLLHENEASAIEIAKESIGSFGDSFRKIWLAGMRSKLGLFESSPSDQSLFQDLLNWMRESHADYTTTFRELSNLQTLTAPPFSGEQFEAWHKRWVTRLEQEPHPREEAFQMMVLKNPRYIPRNHLVEEALSEAVQEGRLEKTRQLISVLSNPFTDQPLMERYAAAPTVDDQNYQTFCGT